jgi:hypothetical protein
MIAEFFSTMRSCSDGSVSRCEIYYADMWGPCSTRRGATSADMWACFGNHPTASKALSRFFTLLAPRLILVISSRCLPKLQRLDADVVPLIPPSPLTAREEGPGELAAPTSTTSLPRFSASPRCCYRSRAPTPLWSGRPPTLHRRTHGVF